MKKLHLAISTNSIEKSVKDYSERLGCAPCLVVAGQYALWRTESINLSIRHDHNTQVGSLRHLGWEDENSESFTQSTDVNGIVWEKFNAEQQALEIKALWPQVDYQPN